MKALMSVGRMSTGNGKNIENERRNKMSKSVELERAFDDAIERIVITKEDTKEVKKYFVNILVNDMIDEITKEVSEDE